MPKLSPFDQPIEMLIDVVLKRLELSDARQTLLNRVRDDTPIEETFITRIVDLDFERDGVHATEIDTMSLSLSASTQWLLDVGFFAPGDRVDREDLQIPWPDQSIASFDVPTDKVLCGLELAGALSASAGVQGSLDGISIALAAQGRAELIFRFFKQFERGTGAKTALRGTLRRFRTPMSALAHGPEEGEVLVAALDGDLSLGAEIGYGWSVEGSRSFGEDLAGAELTSRLEAKAKIGAFAGFHLNGGHNLVVRRGLNKPGWLNVSFVKRRSSEISLGANLAVNASLNTSGDAGRTPAAFVDGLLGRSPLPDLMAELREVDPAGTMEAARAELKAKTIERLLESLRSGLEPAAIAVDEAFAELRGHIETLGETYAELEADLLQMAERALEKYGRLDDIDEIVDTISETARSEDLQELLDSDVLSASTRDKLREVLGWTREILGDDTPLEAWVRNGFSDLRRLIGDYREKRSSLSAGFEEAYLAVMNELGIGRAIKKARAYLANPDLPSLQALLDEKLVWLNQHLVTKIDAPIDRLVDNADKVKTEIGRLVAGYDRAVERAGEALERGLNRQLALSASLSWTRLKENQTLASIDLDPASLDGQAAYRHLLRGDVASALELRKTAPSAVRFLKSYIQEDLSRGFTFRTMVNGRNRLTVDRFLLNSTIEIQATEDGEIYVQVVRVSDELLHETRRAVINVQTMLELAFERHSVFLEDERGPETVDFTKSAISYSYKDELKGTPTARVLKRRLERAKEATQHLFPAEDVWERAGAEFQRVRQFGPMSDVSIRVDSHLATVAFRDIFDPDRDPAELRIAVESAYDLTMRGLPARTRSNPITSDFLAIVRGSFTDLMLDMHREIFVEEHGDRVRPLAGRLGRLMKKLNVAGKLPGRNFAMTVFSRLAGTLDRGASLRIGYVHPVTGRAMEIRSDQLPDRLVA